MHKEELDIFDKIRDNDKIILFLNDNDIKQILALCKQAELFEYYKKLTLSAHNKFQETLSKIWEKIINRHERCETAAYRNKALNICRYNDRIVVVERDPNQNQLDD